MATQLAERGHTTQEKLGGIWSPALTPVDADLKPHAGRFVAHARWLLDNGCHGVVVFGTTGEANSFSAEERMELLDAAVSAGLPRDRLLVGTGCCALTDTVRLTRHALSLGVAGVLVLPPFYYKDNSDEALFNSFDEVIQRVGGGFKLFGGYQFNRNLAVELAYVDLGKLEYSGSFGGLSVTGGRVQTTGFNASAVGIVPLSPSFSLFGKVGVFSWLAKARDVTGGAPFSAEEDDADVSFGLGAAYHVNANVSVRAEWEQFEALDKIGLISIGVALRF